MNYPVILFINAYILIRRHNQVKLDSGGV